MNIIKTFHPLFRTLREALIPDWGEIAISVLAAVIIYGIASYDFFLNKVSGNNPELKTYSYDLFSNALSKLSHLPFASNVMSALLWGGVGIAVYIILILVLNFFITTKNNAILNTPIMGKPELLAFSIIDEYRRLVWVIAFIGLLLITLVYLFPFWLECFHTFNSAHSPELIIKGVLGMALNLYLLYSFLRVMIRNPKVMQ